MKIPVLFVRADSIYKTMADCDTYDKGRNALSYDGNQPVIAHPPCRGWGQLSHMSKAPDEEKELATWAVDLIRKNGGVLEHPKKSKLWEFYNLPAPGEGKDEYGGWTLGLEQYWFGHRAQKLTLLYIVGCDPKDLPPLPFLMGEAPAILGTSGKRKDGTRSTRRPEITKAEREHTPRPFAEWLVALAKRCKLKERTAA